MLPHLTFAVKKRQAMTKKIIPFALAVTALMTAPSADAGQRFVYGYGSVPYYPTAIPYYTASPTVAGYTAISPQVPPTMAMSGHVLVPAKSVDGTPSYAAYHPTLGTFLGWWQLIDGVWQFVQSNVANGGTTSSETGVTKTDFNNFVTQYQSDMSQIKTALKITSANRNTTPAPNTGRVGATGTTPAPGDGPSGGTAVAPKPTAGTSIERLDDIITKLNDLKLSK